MTLEITAKSYHDDNGRFVPSVGTCSCGGTVVLSDGLDNYCDACDRCYNMSGQEVVPSWRCDDTSGEVIRRADGSLYEDY